MSYYQRECPNCAAMIGKKLAQCPHCDHVLRESIPRPTFEPRETGYILETESGQSFLAYRLAAVILFLNVLINGLDVLLGIFAHGAPNVFTIVAMIIDAALGVGLLRFQSGARTGVLFRAVLGAIIIPLAIFISSDVITAVVMTVVQLSLCGSLILLLTGESRPWRLIIAGGLYMILALAPTTLILFFAALMIALQ